MEKFFTPQQYFELLHDNAFDVLLGVNANCKFLAEVAFLNWWNRDLDSAPQERGLDEYEAVEETTGCITVYIAFDTAGNGDADDFESIAIRYNFDPEEPGKYGVQIIHNQNLVYERTAGQDERTEWELNSMGDDPDVTDDEGNMLFVGAPIQI